MSMNRSDAHKNDWTVDTYLCEIFLVNELGQIRETYNVALLNGILQCIFDPFENVEREFVLNSPTEMVDCAFKHLSKNSKRREIRRS